MSGITPLIDTLLPQVLGKRVDIPTTPREINQPVSPVTSSDAVRAVHSDSRLNTTVDTRHLQATAKQSQRGDVQAPARGTGQAGQQSSAGQLSPGTPILKAAEISLSNTAQTLASLLSRPASGPAVVQSTLPLLSPQQPAADTVAANLQSSIRESGLFYESHLALWLAGKVPREKLAQEPQMSLYRQYLSALSASQGGKVALQTTNAALNGNQAAEQEEALQPQTQLSSSSNASSLLGQSEVMRGLVRQQLELLANPVLHWTGEVWSGVVMALLIQIPHVAQEDTGGEHSEHGNRSPYHDEPWNAELALKMENLGLLKIRVSVVAEKKMSIWLQPSSLDVLSQLETGLGELRQQLESKGFGDVELHTSLAESDDE